MLQELRRRGWSLALWVHLHKVSLHSRARPLACLAVGQGNQSLPLFSLSVCLAFPSATGTCHTRGQHGVVLPGYSSPAELYSRTQNMSAAHEHSSPHCRTATLGNGTTPPLLFNICRETRSLLMVLFPEREHLAFPSRKVKGRTSLERNPAGKERPLRSPSSNSPKATLGTLRQRVSSLRERASGVLAVQ